MDDLLEHDLEVRRAGLEDIAAVAAMCHNLWPDASIEEHAQELRTLLAGKAPGNLPTLVFLAQQPDGQLVGFVEVGLRSHADGCDPSHAIGFIEGWYVA